MEVHHVFKGIITACMNGKESVQDPKMLGGLTPWQAGSKHKASQLQTCNFHFLKMIVKIDSEVRTKCPEWHWNTVKTTVPGRVPFGYRSKFISRSVWQSSSTNLSRKQGNGSEARMTFTSKDLLPVWPNLQYTADLSLLEFYHDV